LQATVSDIGELHLTEKWELEYHEEGYSISVLPKLFESKVCEALKFVSGFISTSKLKKENVHDDVASLLKDMFEAFLIVIEKTAFPEDAEKTIVEPSSHAVVNLSHDKKLLVVLSNSLHLERVSFPLAIEECTNAGYPEISNLKQEIMDTGHSVNEQVFSAYIELKSDTLIGSIELEISKGDHNWTYQSSPDGVRQYLKKILMNLIMTHEEINSISEYYANPLLARLSEMLSDEVKRVFDCVPKFSTNGTIQAALELKALKYSLNTHLSEHAKSNFDESIARLPFLNDSCTQHLEELFAQFKDTMSYQLSSLSHAGELTPG
jgi:exocyst complex component 2